MSKWGLQGGGPATLMERDLEKEPEKEGPTCAKALRRKEVLLRRPGGQGRDKRRRGWLEMVLEGWVHFTLFYSFVPLVPFFPLFFPILCSARLTLEDCITLIPLLAG